MYQKSVRALPTFTTVRDNPQGERILRLLPVVLLTIRVMYHNSH